MNNEIIRTLGFYQPYGSLMLHGKVETRFVRTGRKPPFPLGKYLFYTVKKSDGLDKSIEWSGAKLIREIIKLFKSTNETSQALQGYAIGIGELYNIAPLTTADKSFVKVVGYKIENIKGVDVEKKQWALHFRNVQRIEPFEFKFGKQGVGILPQSEVEKIKIIGEYNPNINLGFDNPPI